MIHPVVEALARGHARRMLVAEGKSWLEAFRLVNRVGGDQIVAGVAHLGLELPPPPAEYAVGGEVGSALVDLLQWIAAHQDLILAIAKLILMLAAL